MRREAGVVLQDALSLTLEEEICTPGQGMWPPGHPNGVQVPGTREGHGTQVRSAFKIFIVR